MCLLLLWFTYSSLYSSGVTNPFTNTSLRAHNPNCATDTTYFISKGKKGATHFLLGEFIKIGFVIQCTNRERHQLGMKKFNSNGSWVSDFCVKHKNSNTFCHGTKLIYLNRKCDPFRVKTLNIESKTALNKILTTFCNKYHANDNVCNFVLLSYNLDIPTERNEFLTKHIDCNNNNSQYDNTWILKEDIEYGHGIHVENNHKQIYQLIVANESENIDNCTFNPMKNKNYLEEKGIVNYYKINNGYVINRTGCLIQRFVSNPLLVKLKPPLANGNKIIKHVFHVKSFLLIASYSNPFIVLHWPRPYLLINPNEYNNKQKKSILTNRNIVESNNTLIYDAYDWIWGRIQFQHYLDQEYGNDLFGGNYSMNKLNNDIKHIAATLFHATWYNNKLNQQPIVENENEFHFDVVCMDILINDKFELKLMEINARCGNFCSRRKIEKKIINGEYDWRRDCDSYFNELRQIAMELAIKKSYNHSIENIDCLNNFEIVFWK